MNVQRQAKYWKTNDTYVTLENEFPDSSFIPQAVQDRLPCIVKAHGDMFSLAIDNGYMHRIFCLYDSFSGFEFYDYYGCKFEGKDAIALERVYEILVDNGYYMSKADLDMMFRDFVCDLRDMVDNTHKVAYCTPEALSGEQADVDLQTVKDSLCNAKDAVDNCISYKAAWKELLETLPFPHLPEPCPTCLLRTPLYHVIAEDSSIIDWDVVEQNAIEAFYYGIFHANDLPRENVHMIYIHNGRFVTIVPSKCAQQRWGETVKKYYKNFRIAPYNDILKYIREQEGDFTEDNLYKEYIESGIPEAIRTLRSISVSESVTEVKEDSDEGQPVH